jgi:hypothetical protein
VYTELTFDRPDEYNPFASNSGGNPGRKAATPKEPPKEYVSVFGGGQFFF